MFLKASEAKSLFYEMFSMVRTTKTKFYIDFRRKTIAERPLEETTGTTRDWIGTEINEAGVRSLPGLGFAQPGGGIQV